MKWYGKENWEMGRGWARERGGFPEEDSLEQHLQRLFAAYMRKVHEEGKALRGQGRFLRMLYHAGPMSQKDLQEQMGVQAGSISEIAAKLERKGLICREKSPEDRRRVVLYLTPAGRETVERFREQHPHRHGNLEVLTPEEQQVLCGILEKLLRAWEE